MRTHISRRYIWTRVAAVVVPFVAILGTYFALEDRLLGIRGSASEGSEERVTRIATIPVAEQTQAGFFPDSTYISIKPGSTADYKESAVSRRVELSGEAFFKVTHDEARPFHVSTDRLSLTVLGTHFNVTDHPDNSISEVSLFEGSVLVTTGGVANTLSSGQRLRYDSATGEVSISAIPASEMTAGGYTPRLIFDHATLGEVLDALSAYYGTTVDIGSGMDRTAGDLSVNLEGLTLEQSKELLLKIAFGD